MKYYLHNPGYIPGFPGVFPGNSVVEIDDSTNALRSVSPMFPGLPPQEADGVSPPPSSSASATSVASSEVDAAVLAPLTQSSSPSPAPAPVASQPPQQVIDLPENGG